MKAKLKTGEIVELIRNDDFSAAKYLNKETSEYVYDDEIELFVENQTYEQGVKDTIDEAVKLLEYANAGVLYIDYFKKKMNEVMKIPKDRI